MNAIQKTGQNEFTADANCIIAFDVAPASANLLVAIAISRSTCTFTPPAGWAQDDFAQGDGGSVAIFHKAYAGEGNSFDFARSVMGGDFAVVGYELPSSAVLGQAFIYDAAGVQSLALGAFITSFEDVFLCTGIVWSGNVTGQSVSNAFAIDSEISNPRVDSARRGVSSPGSYGTTWSWTTARDATAVLGLYGTPPTGGSGLLLAGQRNRLVRAG